jgi:hypothetical protein
MEPEGSTKWKHELQKKIPLQHIKIIIWISYIIIIIIIIIIKNFN